MLKRPVILLLLFAIQGHLFAQNIYVSNYTQKEYGAEKYITSPQNWSIEQDSLGRLYVANTSSVLIFDGLNWNNIEGTENKNFFHLSKSKEGIIYTGGRNDLGYLGLDSQGIVIFKSLLSKLNESNITPGTIEWVYASGSSVYFRNEEGIIILQNENYKFFPFKSNYLGLEKVNEQIVVQDDFGNLLNFDYDKIDTLYSFGSRFSSSVVFVKEFSKDEKLVFTASDGILKVNNSEIINWNSANEKLISKLQIKDVIDYPDLRLFGIATKGAGIIFIDYNGQITKNINSDLGLISNTCYSLFRDENKNLWACFDNGISLVEYPSALSYFDITNGLAGIVNCMAEYNNTLYAGTTNGLYYLDQVNQFQKFSLKEGVWDIKEFDGITWVAASSGLYQIFDLKLKLIKDIDARFIEPSNDGKKIWIGLSDGVGFMEKLGSQWSWQGKIDGIDHEVRTIAQESDSVLWVSYEKVSRIVLKNSINEPQSILTMGEQNGISEDFYMIECYKLRGKVYFGTGIGLFLYDEFSKTFYADNSFGNRFADGAHEAFALAEDSDNNIWITSQKVNGQLKFKDDAFLSWDTLAYARLRSTEVWRIVPIPDKPIVYFCTTDGLFRFDQGISVNYKNEYLTIINKVAIDRDSVISYLETGQSLAKTLEIPYQFNNLRFSFTATTYNYGEKILFTHILKGYDKEESPWAPEEFKEYTNLPPGRYTFIVNAKNMYGIEGRASSYSFTILPPWYRSYWAYAIWVFIFISGVIAVDRVQRKRLFKKQEARILQQKQKLERERQISNKLRKVDKLKDEFLANTSHELRTPLNGIIGITESLYEESAHIDEKELKNNLAMVIASGKRLANMVDGILDYSKLKTKNLELKKKPIDLKSIVSVVLTMSRPIIYQNDLKLVNEVPIDLPLADADENRLQQILYNLIGNAIKFTPHGSIVVSAKTLDDFIEVTVSDDGVGIPEDKKDKIFDSYEQENAEVNRDYIGTGLGLTITKKLVELHHGSIRVESEVKKGSKFIFTIPVSFQESPSWINSEMMYIDETEVTGSSDSKNNALIQILIVDDESINRQVIANHLKHEPYYLEMATNGFEALEMVKNKKYDLILLDVMMPKMSGFEVCLKIREKFMLSELPVIFITAKDQVIDLVEGLKYGGNDYITKPFSKQEFLARIKTQLKLEKINNSYARFIPSEFLKSLGRDSIMDVNLGDRTEKKVTILFSDIRGYTTISEKMSPKENFEFLNSFLNTIGPVIRKHNGFVMQYLGDGLMSIFLHDPIDAVNASVDMLRIIEEFNSSEMNNTGKPILVGMGMHTGNLIMGVIGDEKRMDINVVSDSVNTASRMEGLTKYYGTSAIMSERTLDGLENKNNIRYRFLGLVLVKGKTKPLKIFEILDGVSGDLNRIKIETKTMFEEGLMHYFNKEFIKAATELKKVTMLNTKDVTAQMYLKLSAKYMVEGVPENWTGVETMLLK